MKKIELYEKLKNIGHDAFYAGSGGRYTQYDGEKRTLERIANALEVISIVMIESNIDE